MTFNLKIIHKGLILIAVPLLFGIAFVLFIYSGLSQADRKFQHELLIKDAMISVDGINRKLYTARIFAVSYFASREKLFEESFSANMMQAADRYKHLRKLLKSEPGWQPELDKLRRVIISSNNQSKAMMHAPVFSADMQDMYSLAGPEVVQTFFSNGSVSAVMEKLQKAAARETIAAVNSMNSLQMTLLGGMASGILLTVILAIYFSLNITSRLLKIVDNTMRLSRGMPLSLPLQGADEIAELDQFLFKSAAEIRELEQFKSRLIGVVSHELKSPLSSVESFLAAFAGGAFGELSKKAQDRVARAHKSVIRLMGLVGELLDLDRLEAGRLEMAQQQINVSELVTAAVDAVRELSERSGVSIEIKNDADKVYADRDRLVQVIVNLLGNAMKFSPPHGQVKVETRQSGPWFECRVSDQGRGIPESFRKEIFEPFKQIDAKDAATKKGTGLGLTISRSIVEQHGGKIGVDSVEGQGSTFWFRIPAGDDCPTDSKPLVVTGAKPDESGTKIAGRGLMRKSQVSGGGRFRILHKGLILVSVPIIFQLTFGSVIGFLLYQVREQVRREEHSKEIVDSLNHMEERLARACSFGLMYVATQDRQSLESWWQGKQEAFNLLEHVKTLIAGDARQQENLEKTRGWLEQGTSILEKIVNTKESDLRLLVQRSGFIQQPKPLEAVQAALETLLQRENATGIKLAAQRRIMIKNMEAALVAGIVFNIILSTVLSVFFMRSITSRLRHVMENTACLVRRENLHPPVKGSDEIAYLDQVFFETGLHLIELETFKRELISIVSHELRTPLMAVSSTFELFSAGAFGDLDQNTQDGLKSAEGETNRLIRLINNLLDIEKMEAGKFILDQSVVKVSELMEESIKAFKELAAEKQIKLRSNSVDCSLKADRGRLLQVLINLLSNAVKFSPAGTEVVIETRCNDAQVEFRVIDQGLGIPPDLKEKIFDRFVQVDKKDASEPGGSGLGLAISRAIVDQHGGTMGVESEPGRGSTFWFKLPLGKET